MFPANPPPLPQQIGAAADLAPFFPSCDGFTETVLADAGVANSRAAADSPPVRNTLLEYLPISI
ncbi:conserved hypothetical protein [Frankia sp. Hr75.2]|nr:conserved hypothetical protein [Frankia sp. Hr75.2]